MSREDESRDPVAPEGLVDGLSETAAGEPGDVDPWLREAWRLAEAPRGPDDWPQLLARTRKPHRPRGRMPLRRPAWIAAAAAAAIAALVLGVGLYDRMLPPAPTQVTAPAGATAQVALGDAVMAELNAATTVRYTRSRGGDIQVQLDGEAFFDVPEGASGRVTVVTRHGTIRDIGTEFNVRARDEGLMVTVAEGLVEVTAADHTVRIARGQAVRVDTTGFSPTSPYDSDLVAAWRSGRLVAFDEPLAVLAAEIGRRFDIPVRVSPDVASQRMTAVFASHSGDAAMSALCTAAAAECARDGRAWVIAPTH